MFITINRKVYIDQKLHKNMDNLAVLQELGLTENEAKVYIFLLETGSATVAEMTDKLEIHRVNIYDILKRLLEKGLVSYTSEGKKKFYSSTKPDFFLKLLKEKESVFLSILPELELKTKQSKRKHEVNVFQGKRGIKAILEDMLKERKTIHVFGAQGNFANILPIYSKQFNKRRQKNNIKLKIIHSERIREWRNKNPINYANVKFIPEFYDSPSTTFIYGNKVAIVLWLSIPLGISIESKELSESYMIFFNLLWRQAES